VVGHGKEEVKELLKKDADFREKMIKAISQN
jgi:hypothetical protein